MLNQGHILTAAAMQQAEQVLIDDGISVEQLMQRAGQGAAQMIWRISADMPTLVLCGPGNNGGDGYVIAQWLLEKGVDVRVAAPLEPATAAARQAKSLWRGSTESLSAVEPAAQFVDCLFGTGLTRPIENGWFADFSRLFAGAKRRIAIDLPSGIESDCGQLLNILTPFDITIALGAYKPSHFLAPARAVTGKLVGIDIGVQAESDFHILRKPDISSPTSDDHKYSRGLVAIVAGAMHGAAKLTALAAQKAGAGYVKIFADARFVAPHPSIVVETVNDAEELGEKLSDPRISAIVAGPGLGRDSRAEAALSVALATDVPLLLDADALMLLADRFAARLAGRTAETIATPHAGEFAYMMADKGADKRMDCRSLAEMSDCTILLKGADSLICAPDGSHSVATESCSWLSTAGTGDVLAGMIAGRMATGSSGYRAACDGQWLHTRAAQLAGPAFSPEMLIDRVNAALGECL